MTFILHFIFGALLVAAGVYAVKYNYQLTNNFGRFEWAEQHLGGGGTFTLFKILSIIVIVIGVMIAFGLWGPFTNWALSPLGNLISGGK